MFDITGSGGRVVRRRSCKIFYRLVRTPFRPHLKKAVSKELETAFLFSAVFPLSSEHMNSQHPHYSVADQIVCWKYFIED